MKQRNLKTLRNTYNERKVETTQQELITKLVKAIKKQNKNESNSFYAFERFSAILANVAQVLMLIVVIFGYFYTVRPVFQKELISEDLARLKIEENKWKSQIEAQKKEIIQNKNEILSLEETKTNLKKTLDSIEHEKKLAIEKLNQTEISLTETEKRLYQQIKMEMTGSAKIPDEYLILLDRSTNIDFDNKSYFTIAKALKESFIQPLDIAKEKLEKMKLTTRSLEEGPTKKVLSKLLKEYEQGLHDRGSILNCPPPDFDAWQNSFVNADKVKEPMLKRCINYHFDKHIKAEEWTLGDIKALKKTEFWGKQEKEYERSCSINIDYSIENFFREKWDYINEPCQMRLLYISSILLKEKDVSEVIPLRDTSPPNLAELQEEIERKYKW